MRILHAILRRSMTWPVIALFAICCGATGFMAATFHQEERQKQVLQVNLGLIAAQIQERLTELESRLQSEAPAGVSDTAQLEALQTRLRKEFPFLLELEVRDRQGRLLRADAVGPEQRERMAPGQLALLESALLTGRAEYRLDERSAHKVAWPVSLIVPARRGEVESWLVQLDLGELVRVLWQSEKSRWPNHIGLGLSSWAPHAGHDQLALVELSRNGMRLAIATQATSEAPRAFVAEQILTALLAGLAGLMAGLWLRALLMRQQSQKAYRELEAKMQANAKIATLGEMSTAIAHELNQPLGAIENYAYACERILLRSEASPSGVMEALQRIRGEAQRGAEVIRSIRSLARRERGRVERIRLAELFEKLRPLLNIQAQRYGCDIHIEADPTLTVVCEKTLLEQVIVNLTNNGFESMKDTPKAHRRLVLTAELDAVDRSVSVVVSDNGNGVSEMHAASLFKPFFTTKSEGLGIGLNLCQTIAEQQGGAISWHNKAERGAVFTLRLPQAQTVEAL
jgi:signal transduction histidine kinase